MFPTKTEKMQFKWCDNQFYIKRDDMIGYSFGGNKYRKALRHFKEMEKIEATAVITTGSASSNHCRIIANMAVQKQIPCYIISPLENERPAFNRDMTVWLEAKMIKVPKAAMKETIKQLIEALKTDGERPYFIRMGGHGLLGTEAYVEAYNEIMAYETAQKIHFDYIFFADGTGTTHAGLACGKLMCQSDGHIIGISVLNPYPDNIKTVLESVNDYLKTNNQQPVTEAALEVLSDYLAGGYGQYTPDIIETIKTIMRSDGIPLDPIYTGKAFHGMMDYIKSQNIRQKNILFIHTGGAPIFFDMLLKQR